MARSSMLVLGAPAAHASHLASVARWQMLSRGAAAVGAALVAVAVFAVGGSGLWVSVALLSVLGAVVLGVSAREAQGRQVRAAVGARSEKRVAKVLTGSRHRLGAEAVAFGLLLGAGGDVDVVVAGPMLAAVEVKTGTGPVRYADGVMVAGRRQMPGDPVAQVRRQATRLGKKAGVRVQAVVCVVDAQGPAQRAGGVTICSLEQLPEVLAGLPAVLPAGAGRALLTSLARD